jgi:hypothetical protein
VQDLGWHFSWMGNVNTRQIKRKSCTHYDDKLSFILEGAGYNNDKGNEFFENYIPSEGMISPSGTTNTILKKYPQENLPKEIFILSNVKKFLLPDIIDDIDIFKNNYLNTCNTINDINEHLPILYSLSQECSHVTEFGVRSGISTRVFLYSNVVLRSYDYEIDSSVTNLFNKAKESGKDVRYINEDVRDIQIEDTDMLFIDTWHCYEQLKIELEKHANNVRKYIVLHDIMTYGIKGENTEIGLLPALIEFMITHREWRFKMFHTNNNGLIVIEKTYE